MRRRIVPALAMTPQSGLTAAARLRHPERMPAGTKRKNPQIPPASTAAQWASLAIFIDWERNTAAWAAKKGPVAAFAYEFIRFGVKQGWACLFGGLMLSLLLATHLWYPPHAALARYDFLVLSSAAIQIGMLAFRLETLEEAKVILAFHIIGTAMEVFKTSAGSWTYPSRVSCALLACRCFQVSCTQPSAATSPASGAFPISSLRATLPFGRSASLPSRCT